MNSIKPDSGPIGSKSTVEHRRYWIVGALVLGVTWVTWGTFMSGSSATSAGLPDLLGKAQPPLPKGALQVDELKSDPKGFTGTIMVRGVVAVASPDDPQLFGLIDSREARVCKDLHCAKGYLATKVKDTHLKPWDEVNVRGIMTEDPVKKIVYLRADAVENLGSIKK